MSDKKRVLLTGAAGLVGNALWKAWEKEDKYDLTLVVHVKDVEDAKSRIERADIRDYARMRELCQNQDVLVHLAYVSQQHLGKNENEITDIGASMLLFEAAREEGIKKIVYASTNHVTGWNERLHSPPVFSTGDQFRPDSWYGAMKGMTEVAGRYLSNAFEIAFISIRIGSFSGKYEPRNLRHCSTFLTPRDCAQLFTLAVDYEGPEKYIVTYGISGNTDGYQNSFLDIRTAVEVLGYKPQDNVFKAYIHEFLTEG